MAGIRHYFRQMHERRLARGKAVVSSSATISQVVFEDHNVIRGNAIVTDSTIGRGTYINDGSVIAHTKIGRFCCLADHVCVVLGQHPIETFVTAHPAFYYDTTSQLGYSFHKGAPLFQCFRYPDGSKNFQVIIGNDVWIGSHVLILGGVRIGDGAIIAAGSVVTKDVDPYTVVGGVPAKMIKNRFTEEQSRRLLALKWWNKPIDDISANYLSFKDIDQYLSENEEV